VRRFLLHILFNVIKRIRHYGVLASSCKGVKLAAAREALRMPAANELAVESAQAFMARVAQIDVGLCPCCKLGRLRVTAVLAALFDAGRGRVTHSSAQANDAKPATPNGTNLKSPVIICACKRTQAYKPLYRQTARLRGGGSVQQGLSAAFEGVRLCWHRSAADKRYS
jgi:hypothetical protein